MLLFIAVENYRSLHERQELSLVPSSFYKELRETLITCEGLPDRQLLPSAVIYGPNASGKSNLIAAMRWFQTVVMQSHSKGKPDGGVPRHPFALSPSAKEEPTRIEIEFVLDGSRLRYGFEASDTEFTSEWLVAFPNGRSQVLFERTSAKKIKFGRTLKGQNKVISELMRPNSLFLSAAVQNGHEQLLPVHSYIAALAFDSSVSNVGPIAVRGEQLDARIIEFLESIGTGVVGFRRRQVTRSPETDKFLKELTALISNHTKAPPEDIATPGDFVLELEHSSDGAEPVYFGLEDESEGTKRLLLILSSVFDALDKGYPLFIDELDASLHTQVGDAILSLFASRSSNPRGAQLIATTHDTNLMGSPCLRRDQIWFTEKDGRGATHLFPLSDIRTRNTDNIEKGYLQGRYGAIPFSGNFKSLVSAKH
ncbi:ATP-binding protein [Bradyrhizobium sp. IC3195]|uniref:AAA family ATPase n=1 Tax=Bradyrhizobium sp. IC3195 TaxID=2793804 RepID=UPI001CD266B3|nr:ATP-binding protein [Bradyrhizobium sp. IC3195]MCA1471932.1 ATP-binding protein [Bradyrhizobium sp. IC3195]